MKMIKIAPSILSADFSKLNKEISEIEKEADLIHVDVMDGHFVKNITIGPVVVKHIKSKLPLDVHLMIENPENFIEAFAKAGAGSITIHAEVCEDPLAVINKIKKLGCKAGIAINPDKPVGMIRGILNDVDMVLVMSVFPGFAGQEFIEAVVGKISDIRKLNPEVDIEVDGGITTETIGKAVKAGATVVVAGSAIFGKKDRVKAIKDLRKAAETFK